MTAVAHEDQATLMGTLAVGAFVHLSHRRWLVEAVVAPQAACESRLVKLSCIDDDAVGANLTVLWDVEPDAPIIAASAWQDVGAADFDPPDRFGGTLGGLAACAGRLGALIRRAVDLAALCSNDPICAHHAPDEVHGDRPLHGAACHGCVFVAETICEQRNDLLDRSLVTDTLEAAGAGYF